MKRKVADTKVRVAKVTQAIETAAASVEKTITEVDWAHGLSTGSSLLNLACSGRTKVGLLPGYYYLFVGDSNSGKTYFTLAFMAEASINPKYDEYRLIYDAVERGAMMDKTEHFGPKLAARLEPPAVDDSGAPVYSDKVEDFYYHVDDALKDGRPFIYILDSHDSLSSEAEQDKFEETKEAHRKGKAVSGSYGDGKAKKNSSGLRQLISRLEKTKSILVIISQTRDNIGFGAQFNPKTRSGGNALTFYATIQMWSSVREEIKKTIKGKPRQIGIRSKIQIKRSRFSGRAVSVEIPIYWSSGIDDTGSCVDFLIDEGHWKENKGKVDASEFEYSGSIEGLVQKIESENRNKDLRMLVGEVWREIEEACQVQRKSRYI